MVVMSQVKKPKRELFNAEQIDDGELQSDDEGGAGENAEQQDEMQKEIKIIAQEVKIVKSLACNDLNKRNKQMKKLRKWLQLRAQSSFPFQQEDFMRIWKGLYYNMWYSDKPLVQEDLAEQYGKLLECFEGNLELSVNFFGAFLSTMCIHWFGIDQWRIDKFMMLTRRMLRYMFKILKASKWGKEAVEIFNKHATETVLFENVTAKGLTMHYLDIFFEELAKVSEGDISAEQVALFVKPFVAFTTTQKDYQLISHCRTRVFYHLLYQSDLGREYSDKYNAWKEMGFPTKHIDDLEKCEDSEEENADEEENEDENQEEVEEDENNQNKHLDPRAGNVDVFMPVLPLDAAPIINDLETFLYKEECATKRRKVLRKLVDTFKTYQNGEFPLGIKTMPRFEQKSEVPLIKDKIKQLENLENELYGVDRKLKQLTKRKRRKLLKSLNYDEIDESNYEQKLEKALPKDYLVERRKKSQKAFMAGWLEEELDESDIKPKKAKKLENITEKENDDTNQKVTTKKTKKQKLLAQGGTENGVAGDDDDEPQKKLKRLDNSLTNGEKKSNKKSKKINESLAQEEEENDNGKENNSTTNIENKKSKKVKENDTNEKAAANGGDAKLNKKTKKAKQEEDESKNVPTAAATTFNGSPNTSVKQTKVLKISDGLPETPKAKPKEPKVLKISDPDEQITPKSKKSQKSLTSTPLNEWDEPLGEGEIEYFLPSRKLQLKKANADLVVNPLAKSRLSASQQSTPLNSKKLSLSTANTPSTPGGTKRVKIALKHNTSQNPAEYIQQIKSSPNIPYDAKKKPGKGLLKPNAMPSPINPFYKKKIGLKLLNDTI
ncbi:ribosomal RNA processing protein 1 homolog [Musca vetustissima]|uniref:ribosomal RNA processing protein 1 homolog n=1 Tax=Musca vetustissima TaxID=27455 RepID=UPI002AB77D80|nr:ribosomal RNA processing protein 1 homolog [Musca vetustissima]